MEEREELSQEVIQAEPRYCINREISEEEAILSLAEGWSTTEPPTQEMLENSYYAKAFEKIKQGKWTWNWAAARLGFATILFCRSISIFFLFIIFIFFHKESAFWFLMTYLISIPFFGIYGNNFLFMNSKRLYKKGYAFWNLQGILYVPWKLSGVPFAVNGYFYNRQRSLLLAKYTRCERFFLFSFRIFVEKFFVRKAKKEYVKRFSSSVVVEGMQR